MSWYSDGFPLAKAQAYADLTRPFLINDLNKQVRQRISNAGLSLAPWAACLVCRGFQLIVSTKFGGL